MDALKPAPELETTRWFNVEEPVTLASLRGKVVLIEAFQMLCPGCVAHGLPQAQRAAETFGSDQLAVIGLHTVFEHHEAQGTPEALAAFLHEYKIAFPVGIDAPSGSGGPPKTMTAYGMRGTPTLILIDRLGRLRKQAFGREPDLRLGADIMALIAESDRAIGERAEAPASQAVCDDDGCIVT